MANLTPDFSFGGPCGPGHELSDASLGRMRLRRAAEDKAPVLVVLGVHGTECITIIVKHAVVAADGLFVNGRAVPVGTRDPHFEMPGFATCPGVQGVCCTEPKNNPAASAEGSWASPEPHPLPSRLHARR